MTQVFDLAESTARLLEGAELSNDERVGLLDHLGSLERYKRLTEEADASVDGATRRAPRTLESWLADPAALLPPVELIPNLVLEGRATLLFAREKVGKSTLLSQAIAAASRGASFLDGECRPVSCLWYGLDEPPGDLVRRLHAYGADPSRVSICDDRPTAGRLVLEAADAGAEVVVIDALADLLRGQVPSENDSAAVQAALGPYVNGCRRAGLSLVLVHHAGKAQGGGYRGSSVLGASVDVLAHLRAPTLESAGTGRFGQPAPEDEDGADDPRRVLDVRGRGIRSRVRLHFDGAAYHSGDGEPPDLSARVKRALAHGALTFNALCQAVRGRRETVSETVARLVAEGEISRDRSGRADLYRLAERRYWPGAA
jgi:hypothetical protein